MKSDVKPRRRERALRLFFKWHGVPVTSKDWQTGLVIVIHKKGDRRECTNYRDVPPLSLTGKVYAKRLEKSIPRSNSAEVGGNPVRFLTWP